MDLDRVRAFVTAADLMSFTRAAEELGLAQPSLSARIRGLEDEIGVDLFDRSRRQVRLTAAGQVFLGHARRLLAAAQEAVAEARAAAAGPSRRLAITTLAAAVEEMKAGVLVALRHRAPELTVTLTGVPFEAHVRMVRDGEADAAYLWPPYTATTLAGLHVEPLRDFPRLLAVPARHPLATRGALRVADLTAAPQVPLPPGTDPLFEASWRLVPTPPIADVPPVRDVAALLSAVAHGVGCCPVPELLARTAGTPGVAFVPLADAGPATLALAWRRDGADDRHALLRTVARRSLRS
ncbi:LysR family transcriptional regulator [Micromonospora sp. NPDC000089]|uniref:LysR family transcriptional regulator n=1 Tax=unclassified Micromonospora TaxID=2617518 RepID=UPI00368B3C62